MSLKLTHPKSMVVSHSHAVIPLFSTITVVPDPLHGQGVLAYDFIDDDINGPIRLQLVHAAAVYVESGNQDKNAKSIVSKDMRAYTRRVHNQKTANRERYGKYATNYEIGLMKGSCKEQSFQQTNLFRGMEEELQKGKGATTPMCKQVQNHNKCNGEFNTLEAFL